jgi:hypothetical protein
MVETQSQKRNRLHHERAHDLKAALKDNRRLTEDLAATLAVPKPQIRRISLGTSGKSEAVACTVLSDVHCDEVVHRDQVNGLNAFNPSVASKRLDAYFRNSLTLAHQVARDSHVTTIHWSILGDLFSGWIHDELVENNSMTPVQAAQFVGDKLASGLAYWLEHSEFQVVGDMVVGNHGRLTKKLRSAPVGTSLESLVYARLAEKFSGNPRASLTAAPGGRAYRRIGDFTMRLIHGYEIGYGGGIGGVTIPINKKISQWDKAIRADLTVLGHFHQLLNGGNFIVNGSVIGYSPYAEFIAASPEPARQAFFLIHAKHGLALTAPVWLDT